MEELWQSEFSGDVRACDVHISNLRQKIERDPQDPELVLTVRGVGYRLAEDGGVDAAAPETGFEPVTPRLTSSVSLARALHS